MIFCERRTCAGFAKTNDMKRELEKMKFSKNDWKPKALNKNLQKVLFHTSCKHSKKSY